MPKITALIHTHNDEQRIGRALDSLRACDEVLVIDHGSTDDTAKIAGDNGATVKRGVPGVNPGVYTIDARHDWILCILPSEAVGEALEASLFEWKERYEEPSNEGDKDKNAGFTTGFSVGVREETEQGWSELEPETRLVNRKKINWPGHLPPSMPASERLQGDVLRFQKP